MSMISAQIDELHELVGDGSMEWVAGPVRASVLREAADTIWELRDDLQRANAAVQDAEHDESMAWDRVRKAESENARLRKERDFYFEQVEFNGRQHEEHVAILEAENAKLRELIADINALDDLCYVPSWSLDEYGVRMADIERRMRELGIEVN